jgi:hypothetical protein
LPCGTRIPPFDDHPFTPGHLGNLDGTRTAKAELPSLFLATPAFLPEPRSVCRPGIRQTPLDRVHNNYMYMCLPAFLPAYLLDINLDRIPCIIVERNDDDDDDDDDGLFPP